MQPNYSNSSPFVPEHSSTSPGAASIPHFNEWSSTFNWAVEVPSLVPSAHHLAYPTSHSRPSQEQLGTICDGVGHGRAPIASTSQPSVPVDHSTSRPTTPIPTPTKVPRPANAFMLYRSWLMKSGRIPKEVETRQQNISRVAGQCWNLLSDEEKSVWREKALRVKIQHGIEHPKYKFSPERKTPRHKAANPDTPTLEGEDRIRFIREKYVGISGDAKAPPRPRKTKSRSKAKADLNTLPALSYTPASSPASTQMPHTPGSSVPTTPNVSLSRPSSVPTLPDYHIPPLRDVPLVSMINPELYQTSELLPSPELYQNPIPGFDAKGQHLQQCFEFSQFVHVPSSSSEPLVTDTFDHAASPTSQLLMDSQLAAQLYASNYSGLGFLTP